MTLESMVVSRDWQEVSVLECILGSLHIGVNIESDAERARARLSKCKLDALIIDRDLSGTDKFVESVRSSASNSEAIPLLMLSGSRGCHDLPTSGATFYFEKPVSVEQAVQTLSAARNLMLNGRLRYHRQPLDIPVKLRFLSQKPLSVHLMNLSQGGMGIRAPRSLDAEGPVQVRFRLPGTRHSLEAKGKLAWTDGQGSAGIRFLEIATSQQRTLRLWLEKQCFAE